ncbi:MAG TPA: hypothetical protein VHZ76_04030, partial [Gammaproteobacteria bacterium]|nr:hypothetical protein [Gammaproteobacteria bacterium]
TGNISLTNTVSIPLTLSTITNDTNTGTININNIGNITATNPLTTNNGTINITSSSGSITASGAITANQLTTSSVNGTTLSASTSQINNFSASNTSSGKVELFNNAPLTITSINQSGSGGIIINNTNTVNVPNGTTINSNNGALSITATNLNLNSSGMLNSGSGATTIAQAVAGDTIGLGNATGTMTLNNSALSRITANSLTISSASNGQIIVDGVTTANLSHVANGVTLNANASNSTITFQNNASNFNTLTATSSQGINVNAPVSTVGNLLFNGNGTINLNSNLTAGGNLTLDSIANMGTAITLTANNTISLDEVRGSQLLTLIANNSIGNVDVKALALKVNKSNLFGTVNGLANLAAIRLIQLENTITPGTHFFDGIDMFPASVMNNATPNVVFMGLPPSVMMPIPTGDDIEIINNLQQLDTDSITLFPMPPLTAILCSGATGY